MVISSLLGVPDEDQETFRHAIDRMFHIEPGVGMVNEISMRAGNEIHQYLAGLLDARKAAPQDDLLTSLAQAGLSRAPAPTSPRCCWRPAPRRSLACSVGRPSCWPRIPINEPSSRPTTR